MAEKIINGILFIISITYYILSKSLKFGSLSSPKIGFIPQLIGGFAVIVSGVLLVEALLGKGDKKEFKLETDLKRLCLTILTIMGYIFLLDKIGYLIASTLLLVAIFIIGGVKGWKKRIIIPVVSSGAFFIIFRILLEIPLPRGFGG